jgi:hypothetical protein
MALANAFPLLGTAPGQVPVTMDTMAPWAHRIYRDRFPDLFPNMPKKASEYRERQALQPPGRDRSVLAFQMASRPISSPALIPLRPDILRHRVRPPARWRAVAVTGCSVA